MMACHEGDSASPDGKLAESSLAFFIKEVQQYPDSLQLIQSLIQAYRDVGQYDSAMSITNREIQKDSLNTIFWNIKATLEFENGDTLEAIKNLQQAIWIYPDPDYIISLGTLFAQIKNPDALLVADELLRTADSRNRRSAFFIKGLYYNFLGEYAKAIPFLDEALAVDYTFMYAYREKAIALYDLQQYTEALEVLKKAVTLQNNFDEGYYWMGRCYEKLDRKSDARQSYQQALLYDKNYVEAREALDALGN